jgi:hypothetical protein
MFSSRLHWDSPPNPLLELLAAKRAAGIEILDLTESNPTRAGLDYSGLDLSAALAQPGSAVYQPSPRGLPITRGAVAGYYRDKGCNVDPDSIFLTASTSEAYSFLFKLLCDPGDEILVPKPGYPLFDFLTALDSVRPIVYPLQYAEGWRFNFERLEASLGPRARAIVVVSPHNPTGHCLKTHERDRLHALCAERNLALIVDEVFLDYAPHAKADRAGTMVGNNEALTFVVSGLSKIAALPQLKLGWIQISGPEQIARQAAARLEFIADTYLSVSAPAQLAAPFLFARRNQIQWQIKDRLEANYRWLADVCAQTPHCRALIREGGWYAVIHFDDSTPDDERALALLEEDNVFVHPGYFYDFEREGFVVLSLLTPVEMFRAGTQRMLGRWGNKKT